MFEHHPACPTSPPAVGDSHSVLFDPASLPGLLRSAATSSPSAAAPSVSALHAAGLKLGVLPSSLPASNALISAYSHAGLLPSALRAFHLLPYPSTASYTTVLSALSRHGRPHEALSLFAASASAVAPDAELLSCLVSCCRRASAFLPARAAHAYGIKNVAVLVFYASAGPALVALYAKQGKVSSARRVFGCLDGGDVVSWNAMIGGLASAGRDIEAWNCFREMRTRGVRGNARTAVAVLGACDLESGRQVHGYTLRSHGGGSKTILWNALMSMYSRVGSVSDAEHVFLEIELKDVFSWNVMIGTFAKNGYGAKALEHVDAMAQSGMQPDSVTFTAVLMACCHCGMVDEGLALFQHFVSVAGLVPTMEQCACVVDLLARAGRFVESLEFIGQMPMKPNAIVWGALLSASRVHHNVESARIAFEQLVQVEPENAGNFVTMSNIYAKAGMVEDAKRVRMMIDRVELAKPSGQSCVEIV
ncbi:pentatricopeptide repeat-containing protein DOT4, chloroplastic-like [Panicum miliaceum]|uniref:Pentatricopeptide repeat-containing protein DOT4, chloroplastic-like n=1 Tax=Panicum miliaceum TaxID=4540 RepID=A0A3L6TI35_PANMI|nr:pentatricopeptide repeat-containing protein DOT4, chloroplastic-like [Panicum miliaceum]